MFHYLSRLLHGASASLGTPSLTRRLRVQLAVQSLQDRVLPSTSPVMPSMILQSTHTEIHHGKAHEHFTVALTSSTGADGRAEVVVVNGTLTRLRVHIHQAPPNQVFTVAVNGTTLGTFTTNPGGSGKFILNIAPSSLSTIGATSTLTVDNGKGVTLQGTFTQPTQLQGNSGHHHGHENSENGQGQQGENEGNGNGNGHGQGNGNGQGQGN
jgi:hypothetical protein